MVEDGIRKHKVTGIKKDLKATQTYPRGYGVAVHASYKKWRSSIEAVATEIESSDSDYAEFHSDWEDSDLLSVVEHLGVGHPNVRRLR